MSLNVIYRTESSYFELNATLFSGKELRSNFFAISNDYGAFISPFSEDDARERYFEFALGEKIITIEEYEEIQAELSRRGVIEESYTISPSSTSSSTMLRAAGGIYLTAIPTGKI